MIDGGPSSQTLMYVSRHEIEYRRPLPYQRHPVEVELWIVKIGGASLDLAYEIRADAGQEFASVVAQTRVVLVDAETGRPRRVSASERAAWQPFVEERPGMGRSVGT